MSVEVKKSWLTNDRAIIKPLRIGDNRAGREIRKFFGGILSKKKQVDRSLV